MSLRAAGRPGQSNRNSRPRTAEPMTSSAPQSRSTGTRRWLGRLATTTARGTPGAAYVFTRSGTDWTPQAKLTASDGAANDQFGLSVGIEGDTAVVGSPIARVGANLPGARLTSLRATERSGTSFRNSWPRTARSVTSSASQSQ